jgi:VIT1/CCC1 family predicted Fe2+/Mn2+ transporter
LLRAFASLRVSKIPRLSFDFAQSKDEIGPHDRPMSIEHGHSPQEITHRLAKGQKYSPLKDMIYGGIDGAVTTFAIVAGVEGAGLSHSIIVALGLANILADGFSMAASNYSGTKAELDDRKRIIQIEERHIADHPAGEREELRQILALRGLSGPVLEQATNEIARSKENWIDLMLTYEYGLSRDDPSPVRAAIATFAAFVMAGSIPLIPFVFGLPNPFALSVYATLLTFFLIGAGKSRWSLSKWWRSGGETLLIGGFAALLAYGVGGLFHPG